MKKPPDVALAHVLEYGESSRPKKKGYMFMDSPGNDLESIAGQVAAGSNISQLSSYPTTTLQPSSFSLLVCICL